MRGNYPKVGGARVAPTGAAPDPPADLPEAARAEWRQVVPLLWERKITEVLDMNILKAYCQSAAMVWECDRLLQTEGLVNEGPRGALREHPAVKVRSVALEQMRRLSVELGLTPLARGRVKAAEEPPEADPYEELLDG